MAGVPQKLGLKILMVFIPLALLVFQKVWTRFLFFFLILTAFSSQSYASLLPSGCQNARQMMEKSGTARDAKETFFGRIKIQTLRANFFYYYSYHDLFPSQIDQVTWWGKFKPFEFWQRPKFQAAWINPEGQEVSRQEFRGDQCVLAKNKIASDRQPGGQMQPGVWKVVVTCENHFVDQRTFVVAPENSSGPAETPKTSQMIWAKDKV